MKFCMVVVPYKTNLNFYFWHNWMKNGFTKIRVTTLGWQLPNSHELNSSRFLCWISVKFCLVVGTHKINVYFWHDWMKDDVTVMS